MHRDAILSFASKGREDYRKKLLGLIDSCVEHWKGDMLVYSPDHWLDEYRGVTIHKGWPRPKGVQSFTHEEMPYQFKTAMIQLALEMGYKRVFWMDTSMRLAKDIAPLLDNSKTGIVTFHNLGHPTWKYLSDEAYYLLRERQFFYSDFVKVKDVQQIWGGAFMIDFTSDYYYIPSFLKWLKEFSTNGSFKDGGSQTPGFVAHRHDQAVMSVLVHERCDMLPYGTIVSRTHAESGEYGNDHYIIYG